ncbi:MAG: hypothetical protein IJH79_11175 [Lentisphaeria bacterium]|nr:hypothetical protein [Lentisphaeria bacterium]
MDTESIIRNLHLIEQLNLKGKEIVKDFGIAEIERIYNGLGPDRAGQTDCTSAIRRSRVHPVHSVRPV